MKFIIADPTEERNLPANMVEQTTFIAGLEALCGADFIVTPSKLPVKDSTLRIHINKGVCVQRKTAADFVASFQGNDSRLWRQLVRLKLVCPLPWLLLVGSLGNYEKSLGVNCAVVDGRKTDVRSEAVFGAKRAWQLHGGYYEDIPEESLLLRWCEVWRNKLQEREAGNGQRWEKYIRREVVQPLELLTAVETTLCTIPGLGVERAHSLYLETQKYIDNPNLIDCLRVAKDNKVEGIGEKTKESVMKFVGWSSK